MLFYQINEVTININPCDPCGKNHCVSCGKTVAILSFQQHQFKIIDHD